MSARDVDIIKNPGDVLTFQVDDRTTSAMSATFKPGEPLMRLDGGSPYLILMTNGAPVEASDEFVGICAEESTETSTVNGTVKVEMVKGGTVLRGKATTSTNVNTAAKILALAGDRVCFDNTSGVITIDEDQGDGSTTNGLLILSGDNIAYTLDVMVDVNVTSEGLGEM